MESHPPKLCSTSFRTAAEEALIFSGRKSSPLILLNHKLLNLIKLILPIIPSDRDDDPVTSPGSHGKVGFPLWQGFQLGFNLATSPDSLILLNSFNRFILASNPPAR